MSYIQITTRCNMTCDHCCFSATGKGTTMSESTFQRALALSSKYGEFITIGGGEPTSHRDFFKFLDMTIDAYYGNWGFEGVPMIITNGKVASKAHRLLDMVENGNPIIVELSLDDWHDPIDPQVIQRFRKHSRMPKSEHGYASIRTVREIVPVGRAIKFADSLPMSRHNECCCETWLVDPEGVIWSCGCKHTRLGTIWDDGALDGYDYENPHGYLRDAA